MSTKFDQDANLDLARRNIATNITEKLKSNNTLELFNVRYKGIDCNLKFYISSENKTTYYKYGLDVTYNDSMHVTKICSYSDNINDINNINYVLQKLENCVPRNGVLIEDMSIYSDFGQYAQLCG